MPAQPLLSSEVPSVDAIADVLIEAGIDTVFGLSGGHSGALLNALSTRTGKIRTVIARQETLAAAMAEVYGRLTGRPGVLFGQAAWVMGFGLPAMLEAQLASTPMLVISEFSDRPPHSMHAPYQSGTGHYGGWDARGAFRSVCKQVFVASTPAEAIAGAQLALKHSLAGERGPVALLLEAAAWRGNVGPDSAPRLYETAPYLRSTPARADAGDVDRAAATLSAADRPVIIAGNGVKVARAVQELVTLAEHFDIPVVTTQAGKGACAENHDLALGVYGTHGRPTANAALGDADVVLVVGSRLGATDTASAHPALLDPARQTLIQIDVEPRNAAWTFPADQTLIGDAKAILRQLVDAAPSRSAGTRARVAALRSEHGYFDGPELVDDSTPMLPTRAITELRRVLPDDGIVTCDAGENRLFMNYFFQVTRPDTFVQAAGIGPMGYAIPAAMAAKLANPDRPVVAVCSDGGFGMSMNGLMTAREHGLPIVVVVLNNQHLGWSLHARDLEFGTYLGDFDHAAIAESMGCLGIRVESAGPADRADGPLASALRAALDSERPAVVDVRTSLELSYRDVEASLDRT